MRQITPLGFQLSEEVCHVEKTSGSRKALDAHA
jgi:hypothetical protein